MKKFVIFRNKVSEKGIEKSVISTCVDKTVTETVVKKLQEKNSDRLTTYSMESETLDSQSQ
jgi:hypothetical protein